MKHLVELPDTYAYVVNGELTGNWTLARDWCRERFFGRWQYKGLGVFSLMMNRMLHCLH